MIIFLHRIGNWFYVRRFPFIPFIINGIIRVFFRCAIFSETTIGKGTTFGYGGIAVVIHKRAVIGKNCSIGVRVTIGGRSGLYGVPVIGEGCQIGTGAVILGPIVLADNVIVGANAVVLESFPPGSVVAGVPARIIKKNALMKISYQESKA